MVFLLYEPLALSGKSHWAAYIEMLSRNGTWPLSKDKIFFSPRCSWMASGSMTCKCKEILCSGGGHHSFVHPDSTLRLGSCYCLYATNAIAWPFLPIFKNNAGEHVQPKLIELALK